MSLSPLRAAAPLLLRGPRGFASRRSYDSIVIGAGIVGSSSALELRRAGFSVLCIDAGPGPGHGTTSYSSAIVRVFYSAKEPCRLAWESLHGWQQWAEYVRPDRGDEEMAFLRECGAGLLSTPVSPQNQMFLSRVEALMKELEVPVERWSKDEFHRRVPFASMEAFYPPKRIDDERFGESSGEIDGFLLTPGGYVNDPQLAARNVADAALREGAEFAFKQRVMRVDRDVERVRGVTLEDGSHIEAPIVVNAAGPHSAAVHALAFPAGAPGVEDDSRIHSRPLRVEVAVVPGPPGVDLDNDTPMIADMDTGVYMRPQRGGQLLIGSLEPQCDPLHWLETPEDLDDSLSDEWTHLVYRAALRFPSLSIPNTAAGCVSLYDPTPDWTPIYDRSALKGFYSMRGTSGNQFKNGPVVGRILASLVEGCENGHNHDADPIKLRMQHVGGQLNIGEFSRLRGSSLSTGSVMG